MAETRFDAADAVRGARGTTSRSGRATKGRMGGFSTEDHDLYEPSARLRQRNIEELRSAR